MDYDPGEKRDPAELVDIHHLQAQVRSIPKSGKSSKVTRDELLLDYAGAMLGKPRQTWSSVCQGILTGKENT